MDPLKDFLFIATDYLLLINELTAHWKKSPNGLTPRQLEILARLDNFYNACNAILTRASEETHLMRLQKVNEHFKAVILEQELKKAYNKIYTTHPSLAAELLKETALPTKKELSEAVHIK